MASLVSSRFPVEKAQDAFASIKTANPDTYGVIFDYGPSPKPEEFLAKKERTILRPVHIGAKHTGRIRLGLIGVGGHAKEVHLPNLKRLRNVFALHGVASRSGANAGVEAARHGAAVATSDYRELLEVGCRIYEYKKGFVHSKTMSVDGELAIVGTANMDLRSFRLNFEVCAVCYCGDTARTLDEQFMADLEESVPIRMKTFRKRPGADIFLENIARLMSSLL